MSTRLVLLCVGATASFRAAHFPDPGDPLDEGGRAAVERFALEGVRMERCWIAPGVAARETAALLGLAGVEAPALRDMDAGEWAGQGLDAIPPAVVAAWLAAPQRGAPGGETLAQVGERVGDWLDALDEGRGLAVTHVAVIRAAIAHALGIAPVAALRIDVTPLMRVTLSRQGRWRLQEMRRA